MTILLEKVRKLLELYKQGVLGGEKMPEDSNPKLNKNSNENLLYFTLPMALNYQRNSYKMWESALATYNDKTTRFVFDPKKALSTDFNTVKAALTKYKLALQPTKQTEIWLTLCQSFINLFNGNLFKLFETCNNDVNQIREYVQVAHKKEFPYLSGNKICNYWLYVLINYANLKYVNREALTVAPDTHVIKASYKLGLITQEEFNSTKVQQIVISRWGELLNGEQICPIDIHTALWLWSRNGFKEIE